MAIKPSLIIADVMHKRMRPRAHGFRYKVYYLCFALSQTPQLANRFLSLNRWNLLSFYNRDHGARDGGDPAAWVRNILGIYNLGEADGEVILLTLPRILGFVFNPVSFWFCLDHNNDLRAVVSEVSNTFGEHHAYISYHDDHRVIAPSDGLRAEKVFHVSPFLAVKGYYMFRFTCRDEQVAAQVNHFDEQGLLLATSLSGTPQALTAQAALRAFVVYPLITFKVIALIHLEALRLVVKGLRYFQKPAPPLQKVTR